MENKSFIRRHKKLLLISLYAITFYGTIVATSLLSAPEDKIIEPTPKPTNIVSYTEIIPTNYSIDKSNIQFEDNKYERFPVLKKRLIE